MAKHIMIDIETLSTQSDAAIISIGACSFHLDGTGGDCGDETFLISIERDWYDSVMPNVFDVDPLTVAWWDKQDAAAKAALSIDLVDTLPLALDVLKDWFSDIGFVYSTSPFNSTDHKVWANPTSFDLVILRHGAKFAYGSAKAVPWHFRQEMCGRTHSAMYRNIREAVYRSGIAQVPGMIRHRADHDAVAQARMVQEIEKLREHRG